MSRLRGENIVIGVADDGLDHMSCFFHDPAHPVRLSSGRYSSTSHRKIRQYLGSENNVAGGHGTHICGSLAGETSGAESDYNGIAYKAKVVCFYFYATISWKLISSPCSMYLVLLDRILRHSPFWTNFRLNTRLRQRAAK